eukprot:c10143_g1_i1.p1 GENE.c10143_g1_i1~~c10143_g1_i1.p1  ORF type:complete len:699 (-),score=199.46 c10143_g1_i1:174-2270(-)
MGVSSRQTESPQQQVLEKINNTMSMPKFSLPVSKLDKLAEDLAKLEVQTVVQIGGTGGQPAAYVPAFQRQGYLEKLGHSYSKWFKRFFVLRDSFLLSYNLQKSDFTVEPRAAIHLGNASIQVQEQPGHPFCFVITTVQQDKFQFSCQSEEERTAWIRSLETSRSVTHANMVKLAVEIHCLAEEKGASGVALQHSVSALSIFSNSEYIRNTAITGGAEGWLRTLGFNPDEQKRAAYAANGKKALDKCYFILRDSHLLMFHGGDVLTKPRGAMYLLGTIVVVDEDEGGDKDEFRFTVKSKQCGDEIALVANSHKVRTRWVQALRIGTRVTYPDYQLLRTEHALLSTVTMTPRAAPPSAANQPAPKIDVAPPPLVTEDVDIQGQQLDPGTQQAFDDQGAPLLRNPDGKLVSAMTGEVMPPTQARFGSSGEQLDPFNRPLPPGAVPMFTSEGKPIGVGPDGQHYLPDGTVVTVSDPHYDNEGNALSQEVVDAANAVATNVNVAIKVRAMLRGEDARPEAVDVLGRTFRESTDKKSTDGMMINADGDAVPLASARRVEASTGQLVNYQPESTQADPETHLVIKVDEEGEERQLGSVEISHVTTLREVRGLIEADLNTGLPDFVFLMNGAPLLKYEENDKLARNFLPEVIVRGKELKKVEAPIFNKKVAQLAEYEDKKKQENDEFLAVMNRVRQGKYLRSTKLE